MRTRLIGGIAALAITLGALAFPSAEPAQARSTCTGWTSTLVPPTSIRVYRTATKRTVTVPFRTYVEKVMASEWGATAPAAALRAGAIVAKQFAWYYTIHWRGGRDAAGRCYDVVDSSRDQLYRPSRATVASHRAAVAETWWVSLRKGDRLFLTGYRPGTGSCTAHIDGWKLYQSDAVNCVRRYGDSAERLVRRFFGSVSWVEPGLNDFTGDLRGDAAVAVTDPVTGELTARVLTADAAYAAAVKLAGGPVLGLVPAGTLLGRVAADVTGDGRHDIVQLISVAEAVAELQVLRGTAGGFEPAATWWSSAGDPAALLPGALRLVVGDFGADGKADAGIVRTSPAESPPEAALWVAASTGSSFGPVRQRWLGAGDFTAAQFLAGDFSGDGRADVAILAGTETTTTVTVAVTSPTNLRMSEPTTWATEGAPLVDIAAVAGDANRDGRDDLLLAHRNGDGTRVLVERSTGTSFTRTWFGGPLPVPHAGTRFTASDLNRDGRADLLAFVDRGVDETGAPRGTDVWRLTSNGSAYTGGLWLTDATLAPATYTAH